MAAFAKKVYLELPVPSEADFAAGRERVLRALGQEHVHVTMGALQELYPTLQEADYRVTVTLCPADGGWDLIWRWSLCTCRRAMCSATANAPIHRLRWERIF